VIDRDFVNLKGIERPATAWKSRWMGWGLTPEMLHLIRTRFVSVRAYARQQLIAGLSACAALIAPIWFVL